MNIMVRMYTFNELMARLTPPKWSVIEMEQGFVFVPNWIKHYGKKKP